MQLIAFSYILKQLYNNCKLCCYRHNNLHMEYCCKLIREKLLHICASRRHNDHAYQNCKRLPIHFQESRNLTKRVETCKLYPRTMLLFSTRGWCPLLVINVQILLVLISCVYLIIQCVFLPGAHRVIPLIQ